LSKELFLADFPGLGVMADKYDLDVVVLGLEKKWERVRNQVVANMTNFGFPYIEVADGDYDDNRELYLKHKHEGVDLDVKYARKTVEYVHKLWGRQVHLETVLDGEPIVMHYDGKEHTED